jgi:hypothetical protein
VLIAHPDPLGLRDMVGDIDIPIINVRQITFLIHFDRSAFYRYGTHALCPLSYVMA